MSSEIKRKYWVVIPAAGSGSRMGADLPKQYLQLAGKTVIEHTLSRFSEHPKISGIVVALSSQDKAWDELQYKCPKKLIRVEGGAERYHSVLNALGALSDHASEQDWVLVHDAARPCLQADDIDQSGHAMDQRLFVAHQARCQDRQTGVLRAADCNLSLEPA